MLRRLSVAVVGATLAGAAAQAQDFPNRPMRIVASEAGGGGDFSARLIAQNMAAMLGQSVVVENRGGGVIAGDLVAHSPADGYTMLLYGNTFWLLPLMRKSVPYDPLRDFAPVAMAARATNVLVVHPSLPVNSVKELIGLAKVRPGALNFGTAAAGTINHLAGELFKYMAGVDVVRIPYRGTASVINALMSGQVQFMFATSASVTPHVKGNRLRALAVTSLDRSPLFPQLPSMSEAGLKGFESVSLHGVFVPAKTPVAIIDRLNGVIGQALNQPEARERLLASGVEPLSGPPGALTAAIQAEIARMGKVISAAGIRDD